MKNKLKVHSKKNMIIIMIAITFLVLFAVGGFFACRTLTQNDKFEILGEKNITIQLGQEYQDEGAIAIFLGKDISNQIKVEDNIEIEKPGTYYIKYSIDNIFYKNVFRYRYITVVEVNEWKRF